MKRTPLLLSLCTAAAASACLPTTIPEVDIEPGSEHKVEKTAEGLGEDGNQPLVKPVSAPAPSARLGDDALELEKIQSSLDTYFTDHVGWRHYIQIDKPIYKPGEAIWFRTWDLKAQTQKLSEDAQYINAELLNPKGAVVLSKGLQLLNGVATNDFIIPEEAKGGEYSLRVQSFDGKVTEKPILVSVYEPPRIQKKMEFLKKAYGPGDSVSAALEIKGATGDPLANQALNSTIFLDGQVLPVQSTETDSNGEAMVIFDLPQTIHQGDGLLTVMVERGGITESISKRIPIVLKKVQLSFYPEGGDLVEGLASRVYFEAKNSLGKPADIEGVIKDDRGNRLARFDSYKDGLGRLDFTPTPGRTYHAEITKPVGISGKYPLPLPKEEGCVLTHYDDLDSQLDAIRVGVDCTEDQSVMLHAMVKERELDSAAIEVESGTQSLVYLQSDDAYLNEIQGVVRVTLFNEALEPQAERLIYRNRRNALNIEYQTDKTEIGPQDMVVFTVKTTNHRGEPIPADLALSVVDDTVISFADDKTAHMTSRLYLESELPGEIDDPNFYMDLTEEKSALALDLLMGTRGWRKFEWRPVLNPPPPRVQKSRTVFAKGFGGANEMMAMPMAAPAEMAMDGVAMEDMVEMEADLPVKADQGLLARQGDMPEQELEDEILMPPQPAVPGKRMKKEANFKVALAEADVVWEKKKDNAALYAPVRVFPIPRYDATSSGIRSDFRDTIFWNPSVKTDDDGVATVSFPTSDAVTSFRIISEGVGGGLIGRDEHVFESSLPFNINAILPLAVTEGDEILLPLALENTRAEQLKVQMDANFGPQLALKGKQPSKFTMDGRSQESLFYPLDVVDDKGDATIQFMANSKGLKDGIRRQIQVEAKGFPMEWSTSGTALGTINHTVNLENAREKGLDATIKFYPSPISTLVSGMEGMLREPSGCFEQTSSTNYPNIMVMQYLEEHDAVAPQIATRSMKLMDKGYQKLVGYETEEKGYEWFGGAPGHEALTAYGVLEFVDMKSVYPDVSQAMIDRTSKWLLSRRDGKGGYKQNKRALDSFGRASKAVTDAYITYSLTEAGIFDIKTELEAQRDLANKTKDPYLLALSTASLLNAPDTQKDGQKFAEKLAKLQDKDGAFTGADHSITRSGGQNLTIESTALSALALMKTKGFDNQIRGAITYLQENRGGYGQWGATQATVLALKAMTTYASHTRVTQSDGSLEVIINGKKVGTVQYEKGQKEAILFENLGSYLNNGKNDVKLIHNGEQELPYTMVVSYRSEMPNSSDDVNVDLTTTLNKSELKMGESVRLNAEVVNKRNAGLPMTMVRVGLPGGLTFQNWQLKELREKGEIAFFETRAREVILYLRDMKPSETKTLPLDLIARVPGTYTAPASSAYLYYDNEDKDWEAGLTVKITP